MSKYSDRLLDPRWQRKRLDVLKRSDFKCDECGESKQTLHVHHRYYISRRMPWEYPDFCYRSLCSECHEYQHQIPEEKNPDGTFIFEEWECGLNHFGDKIFDMAADDFYRGGKYVHSNNVASMENKVPNTH